MGTSVIGGLLQDKPPGHRGDLQLDLAQEKDLGRGHVGKWRNAPGNRRASRRAGGRRLTALVWGSFFTWRVCLGPVGAFLYICSGVGKDAKELPPRAAESHAGEANGEKRASRTQTRAAECNAMPADMHITWREWLGTHDWYGHLGGG